MCVNLNMSCVRVIVLGVTSDTARQCNVCNNKTSNKQYEFFLIHSTKTSHCYFSLNGHVCMCIRVFQPYVKYYIVLSSSFVFPADIISCVEFNHDGDLLATGDKGGRVVIFQRDPVVSIFTLHTIPLKLTSRKK